MVTPRMSLVPRISSQIPLMEALRTLRNKDTEAIKDLAEQGFEPTELKGISAHYVFVTKVQDLMGLPD